MPPDLITAAELERTIRSFLGEKRSPLAQHAAGIVRAGLRWGVHPAFLVAVAWAETRAATDPRADREPWRDITDGHNAWGWGPHKKLPSWPQAIDLVAQHLRDTYLDDGLITILAIRNRWAPLGAANDPDGLNDGWAKNVRTVYEQLGGTEPVGPAATPWRDRTWTLARFPWLPKEDLIPTPEPKIVTRAQWGAKPPNGRATFTTAPNGAFLHYTAAEWDRTDNHADCPERVRRVQAFHQGPSRGWADIAYSWLYCRHGVVFEGRGWGVQGAHTVGFNSTAHAFCFLGTDKAGRDDLTDTGRHAVSWLIGEAFRRYPEGRRVRGHGDVNPTACPGAEIRAFIATQGWLLDEPPAKPDLFHGYWRWLAWNLGEGEYKEFGPKAGPRPDVPRTIPKEWQARRSAFLARRTDKP